jgi:hypothetical protein
MAARCSTTFPEITSCMWPAPEVPESRQANDFDYDLFNGRIQAREGSEPHGIRGVPIYDPGNGDNEFALAPDSPGYDAGVRIPNFNDDFTGKAPDMGAHEAGTEREPPMNANRKKGEGKGKNSRPFAVSNVHLSDTIHRKRGGQK